MLTDDDARQEIRRLEAMATRHTADWRGRALAWRRFGDGPPLVLIHGGHGSWLHWVRNIDALAQRHTLWLPDLPGMGDSEELAPVADAGAGAYMQSLAEAVAGTLNGVAGENTLVDVAGFSFGGLVAAHVAGQRGRVRRLALLGSAGHGGARRQAREMMDWRVSDPDARLAAFRNNLSALLFHRPDQVDPLAMAVYERCCTQTRFRSKPFARSALLPVALERCMQPLLLMWGEHDVTGMPEEIAQRLVAGRRGREWCVVPNAGHWVQYERAHETNQLMLAWFGSDVIPNQNVYAIRR